MKINFDLKNIFSKIKNIFPNFCTIKYKEELKIIQRYNNKNNKISSEDLIHIDKFLNNNIQYQNNITSEYTTKNSEYTTKLNDLRYKVLTILILQYKNKIQEYENKIQEYENEILKYENEIQEYENDLKLIKLEYTLKCKEEYSRLKPESEDTTEYNEIIKKYLEAKSRLNINYKNIRNKIDYTTKKLDYTKKEPDYYYTKKALYYTKKALDYTKEKLDDTENLKTYLITTNTCNNNFTKQMNYLEYKNKFDVLQKDLGKYDTYMSINLSEAKLLKKKLRQEKLCYKFIAYEYIVLGGAGIAFAACHIKFDINSILIGIAVLISLQAIVMYFKIIKPQLEIFDKIVCNNLNVIRNSHLKDNIQELLENQELLGNRNKENLKCEPDNQTREHQISVAHDSSALFASYKANKQKGDQTDSDEEKDEELINSVEKMSTNTPLHN